MQAFKSTANISRIALEEFTIFLIAGTYVGWSLYNINFIKSPQLEAAFEDDNYAETWLIARDINNSFPFIPKVKEALDQLSREVNIDIKQNDVDVYWKPYGMTDFEWEFIGTDPDKPNLPVGTLSIDSIFNPVTKASFNVQPVPGAKAPIEILNLNLQTDGSITAKDAVSYSATYLRDHLVYVEAIANPSVLEISDGLSEETMALRKLLSQTIDEMELSVRSYNFSRRLAICSCPVVKPFCNDCTF